MTIHRDMDKLRDDFRAPIKFNYTENGFYYYELYEFTLQKTLEENELQLLTEAKIFLYYYCDSLHRIYSTEWTDFNASLPPMGEDGIYRPEFAK